MLHGMTVGRAKDVGVLKQLIENESSDGRSLARNLADNPIRTVARDDSVPCLFVQWKNCATSAQIRFIHECLIDLIKGQGVSEILGDDTALVNISSGDQDWIAQDWLPRARVAGLRTASSKGPNGYYGRTSVIRIQSMLSSKLIIRSFDDLENARKWLARVA
jgi:hypothetical protein